MRALLLAMPLLLAFCDPGWGATGTVTTVAPGGGNAAPTPLAGADVTIRCPGNEPVTGKTDADGTFKFGALGFLADECVVHVAKTGYAEQEHTIDDVCAKRWRRGKGACHHVRFDATLKPDDAG